MRALVAVAAAALGCASLPEIPREFFEGPPLSERTQLDGDELVTLANGARVSHASRFEHDGGQYIAATSYVLVRGKAEDLWKAAENVESLHEWLPFNERTQVVARDGRTVVAEMAQGIDPFIAVYSLRVTRSGSMMRWELDRDRPHDIRDTWGFMMLQQHDASRSLLIVGLALDLGDGMVRNLLEPEIHKMMMWAVDNAANYLEGRATVGCAEPAY
jgi:ribosome-associated toxin RatA of RatAB toxin-antitoxin module